MLEVFYNRIYKVFAATDKIDGINEQYWNLVAEMIPPEDAEVGPNERLIHVYHFGAHTSGGTVANFGQPFLFKARVHGPFIALGFSPLRELIHCVPRRCWRTRQYVPSRVEYRQSLGLVQRSLQSERPRCNARTVASAAWLMRCNHRWKVAYVAASKPEYLEDDENVAGMSWAGLGCPLRSFIPF